MGLQRFLWWIGRLFCEEDERVMARRIAALEVREAACEQRFADLKQDVAHLKAEYFTLFQQSTKGDEPGLYLIEEEA